MGYAEEMAAHEETFKSAEPAAGPVVFSDGSHQAIITVARVEEGQYGWQLILGFKGTDTNTKNPASIRKWHNLPPEGGREQYLAGDLVLLGYDYKERGLGEIEKACVDEEFINLVCDIGVKTKPGEERDYTNVFLNRVHGKGDPEAFVTAGAPTAETAPITDDDIPF